MANSNYTETKEGWWKKEKSTTKGPSLDWERPKRISDWVEQIRRERAERNKKSPK